MNKSVTVHEICAELTNDLNSFLLEKEASGIDERYLQLTLLNKVTHILDDKSYVSEKGKHLLETIMDCVSTEIALLRALYGNDFKVKIKRTLECKYSKTCKNFEL